MLPATAVTLIQTLGWTGYGAIAAASLTLLVAVVVSAGLGMLIAYGACKLLGLPVTPLTLGIGAAVGGVGGMFGFWARLQWGSGPQPRPVDVDITQTDTAFYGNAGNRAFVDQTDLSRPLTIDEVQSSSDLSSSSLSSDAGSLISELAENGGGAGEITIADIVEAGAAFAGDAL
jgi:hypothetical protein